MTTLKLPRIVGIDQLSDETRLQSSGDTMFVRQATNANIDRDGNVSRRSGQTAVLSGSGYHSLYASKRGWLMLCHKQELGVLNPGTGFTVLANMNDTLQTSYAEENGFLYVMNPSFSCKFRPNDSTPYSLGVELPNVPVAFSADTSAGSLEAGSYGVTYSVVDSFGEESGLGPTVKVDLSAQGRIQGTLFTVMPGYTYRIYMTTVNGEELYQAAEFAADRVSFDIMDHDEGRQPQTDKLEPVPNGHIVRAFNSRLLVGTTDFVYFTEPFRPHLHDAAHGWIATTGFTTMVEPVVEGVYVADKRGVRFYRGQDPMEWREINVSPEPVIWGTSLTVPGAHFGGELAQFEKVAVWLSTSGFHVGTPSGEVVKLNAQRLRLPNYPGGCAALVVQDGRKQIVSPVNSNVLATAGIALDSSIN